MADLSAYDTTIEAAAREWGHDPNMLRALLMQENPKGNPGAVSPKGAFGIGQIMPDTAKGLGMTDPKDPTQQIFGAAKYLAEGRDKEGSHEGALLYYHGGPDWRSKYGPESQGYVPGVAAHYTALTKKGASVDGPAVPSDDEFLKQVAPAQPASVGAVPSDDEFLKQTGAAPAPEKSAGPAQPAPVTPNDITGEGRDEYGNPLGPLGPPGPAASFPTVAGMREALAPTPGWVSSGLLPIATKEVSPGQGDPSAGVKLDWGPVRTIGNPLLDLLEGTGQATSVGGPNAPLAGKVSPEASALLLSSMLGNPNPLTGARAIGKGGNPMAEAGPFSRGAPLTPTEAAAALAKSDARAAPLPADFRASPTAPGFDGPSAAPVMIDVGGGRSIPVPAANPLTPPADVNPNLPANMLQDGGRPMGGPASPPGAVGADITTAPIPGKTPAQRIVDLEKSVQQTAEERAGPQLRDATPYVEGIPPRVRASSEFTPANALDHKVAIATDPAYRAEVEATVRERNNGMVDLLRNDALDGNALERAHEYRDEVKPGPLGVFDEQKPVDASGLVDTINGLLRGQEGKQAAVRNTLKSVLDSLHDQDGNIETLPSMLYGARKNLTDLLKKGVKGVGDMADDVRASKSILTGLLPDFDKTISEGAPKFSTEYLPQFHERSLPIDQMEFLQKYQTGAKKITDGDGYLQPNKVQKMLDDILQGLKAPGVNAAKSLTDRQIQAIINVRNELAADKLRDRMASVRGADTFQQINRAITPTDTPTAAAAKGAAVWGAHGAMMASPAAGWGNALLGGYQAIVRPAVKAAQERKAATAIAARKNYLLTPLPPENP